MKITYDALYKPMLYINKILYQMRYWFCAGHIIRHTTIFCMCMSSWSSPKYTWATKYSSITPHDVHMFIDNVYIKSYVIFHVYRCTYRIAARHVPQVYYSIMPIMNKIIECNVVNDYSHPYHRELRCVLNAAETI